VFQRNDVLSQRKKIGYSYYKYELALRYQSVIGAMDSKDIH
jgi:hypothetical protein